MSTEPDNKKVIDLSVDDGLEKIVVKNRYGDELGVFCFRSTDTRIIDRYNDALTRLDKALEPIMRVSTHEDDAAEENVQTVMAAVKEARNRLCDVFDYIFDANVSEAFFSRVDPFTLAGGRFYCENVIEAIGSYIAARFGREVKQLNTRVDRYTHGYRTGKHKNGK